MCNFLSFVLQIKPETKAMCADLLHHEKTVEFFHLQPGEYREVEWRSEDDSDLEIRLEDNESYKDSLYRKWILNQWPNRTNFLDYLLKTWVGGSLDLSGTQITALPDGLSVGGYLDLSGTQIKKKDVAKSLRNSVIM